MFLGIDGGGSGCRARLVDARGRPLGEGVAGAANLTLGVEIAAAAIRAAADLAFRAAGVPLARQAEVPAGMGLAAANVPSLAEAFARLALPFHSVVLASDAVTACLGAHGGRDGAILILGTGSQGIAMVGGVATAIGGWGFAVSDDASGAALGRGAVRAAVAAVDGLVARTGLTAAMMTSFGDDPAGATDWARTATPRDYAAFAPLVLDHAADGDEVAVALLRQTAREVDVLLGRLVALGASRVALMGGLARPYAPWLSPTFQPHLVAPEGDALDGAIRLARDGRAPR